MVDCTIHPKKNDGNAFVESIHFHGLTHTIEIEVRYVIPDTADKRITDKWDTQFSNMAGLDPSRVTFSTDGKTGITCSSSATIPKENISRLVSDLLRKRWIGYADNQTILEQYAPAELKKGNHKG